MVPMVVYDSVIRGMVGLRTITKRSEQVKTQQLHKAHCCGIHGSHGVRRQVENVVVELICWKKKELLKAFDASDTRNTMTVPLDTWIAVMSQKLTEVPA
eukprot:506668-Amphidinium_carterae.1